MASEIMHPKVETRGYAETIGLGGLILLEEKLATPVVGNGTIVSGIAKAIVGGIIDGHGGKGGKLLSDALVVDAGMDIALTILNLVGLGNGAGKVSTGYGGGGGAIPGLPGISGMGGGGGMSGAQSSW